MRLRIGSGFGIPVYLHWTFFLVPLWVLWTYKPNEQYSFAVTLTSVLAVFACIVLHEFGHALTARGFGIPTKDVTLYPIGGVARLMKLIDKPHQEILIALAGPAVNVVIAALLFGVLVPLAVFDPDMIQQTFLGNVAKLVLMMNVGLVLFNMLPLFPMDGGRVLRALLSWAFGHYRATQIAVAIGMALTVVIGALVITFLGFDSMFLVIAVFVFFAGQQELFVARMLAERRLQRDDDEPLEVPQARPVWPRQADDLAPQAPALIFQPKISVYTWDNQTGTWRQEPRQLT